MMWLYGAWKYEGTAKRARFIRQKCYIEDFGEDRGIEITCAGLPKDCYDKVSWENFKTGFSCSGKLVRKHVKRWHNTKRDRFYIKRRKSKANGCKFF